jgi:hypothetical protein
MKFHESIGGASITFGRSRDNGLNRVPLDGPPTCPMSTLPLWHLPCSTHQNDGLCRGMSAVSFGSVGDLERHLQLFCKGIFCGGVSGRKMTRCTAQLNFGPETLVVPSYPLNGSRKRPRVRRLASPVFRRNPSTHREMLHLPLHSFTHSLAVRIWADALPWSFGVHRKAIHSVKVNGRFLSAESLAAATSSWVKTPNHPALLVHPTMQEPEIRQVLNWVGSRPCRYFCPVYMGVAFDFQACEG